MLGGPPGTFWPKLADGFAAAGHRILKVHVHLGDRLAWGRRPARAFRGRLGAWRGWLDRLIAAEGVTDILYYADRVPYHAEALEAARAAGVRAWALEFGYLRPDWITLEPEGMGVMSRFPRSAEGLAALARGRDRPDTTPRHPHGFWTEAVPEVLGGLAQTAGRPLYPFHVHDRPVPPVLSYLAWLPQLALGRRRERDATAVVDDLLGRGAAFTLVALQLEEDYQIRSASPYAKLIDFLDEVIDSFRRFAPPERQLVVKVHPLDAGLGRWFERIPALAARQGVADRVRVIRGGDLDALIGAAKGVVLVNSTVGLAALRAGVPVIAKGTAIYDVPGLTHGSGIDTFWTAPERPDPALWDVFERALGRIQVKGSFYVPEGQARAIREIVRRVGTGAIHAALAGNPRAGP